MGRKSRRGRMGSEGQDEQEGWALYVKFYSNA